MFKSGKQRGWYFEQEKQEGKTPQQTSSYPMASKTIQSSQTTPFMKPTTISAFQPQTLQNKINLNHPDLTAIHKQPGFGQIKLTPSPKLPQIPKVQFPKLKKLIK